MLQNFKLGKLSEPLSKRAWDKLEVTQQTLVSTERFRKHGLVRGDRVFIGYGNQLTFFADLLAVWQIGACAIPIDPRLTVFEIESLVLATRPRLFVYTDDLDANLTVALGKLGAIPIKTDRTTQRETADSIAFAPADEHQFLDLGFLSPTDTADLDQEALILFTSGSTGNPKGVVHTHRSLQSQWMGLREHLGLDTFQRTLCLLPTHFGHGLICNCLFPWLSDQELYILPPFTPNVVMRLGEIIDDNDITFLSSVPSVWRLALRTARPPRRGSLQRVFCGSAPLSADLWQQIQKWSGAEVCNAYGITETSSWIGGTTLPELKPQDGLIGIPWGSEIKIMRGGGAEAAPGIGVEAKPGEEGDVWVKTPALMRGYLDRDDLTRQVVNAGWFSTGDIGLVNDHGLLILRGRKRDEINKGGMKIYPSDIDQVAERFPAVIDTCCFAYEDSYYGQNVGIGLVLNETGDAPVRELHFWMRKHLAEHKMPVRWYLLEQIPRTSRGKVNRLEVAHHCARLEPLDLRRVLRHES